MKVRRQRKILEIIRMRPIETQEELVLALRQEGFNVTQATVSRDVKELGLVKLPRENTLCYASPEDRAAVRRTERLRLLFRDSVLGVDYSENLVLVKTLPGEAQGVAAAIDRAGWSEVLGTVAGDDTIIVVVKPREVTPIICQRFRELLGR